MHCSRAHYIMDRRGIIFIWVSLVAVQYSVHCCEENVRLLNDLELRGSGRQSNFWNGGNDIVLNDADLIPRWYSTTLYGWQYLMTDITNEPNFLKCSTYLPIYLKANHTLVNNLGEDPTDIVACVRDDKTPCSTKYSIQVRKCNDDVQYKLKPTTRYSAYCFEKHGFLSRPAPYPAPRNVNLGTITVKPELKFKTIHIDQKVPHLQFRCQFNNETDLFYTVTWYVDETPLNETMGPSTDMAVLVLNEEHLTSRNISLGIYIRCGVSASIGADGMLTAMDRSTQFYAGIKIANTNMYVEKGSSAVLQIVETVPIGCRYLIGTDTSMVCRLDIKIAVEDNNLLQCGRGTILNKVPHGVRNQNCAQYIKTLTEGEIWEPTAQLNFTIVTSDLSYEDKAEFGIQLQFGETMGQTIWKDFDFPNIKVFVQNTNKFKPAICKSGSGQHMRTADGYYYENKADGTYMMYINYENNIQVQQIIKQCGNGRAKCACAVAINAGQDVFMVNRCGSISYLGFTQCGDGGILDIIRINDFLYKVITPVGTQISIALYYWGIAMNVEIIMTPKDMGNVYGLCGRVDGDRSNDLTNRHSHVISPLGKYFEFIESWRIEGNAEENLFKPIQRTLTPWAQQNGLYCACKKNEVHEALCSPTQNLNCYKQDSITEAKCHINGRRKRRFGGHNLFKG